VVQFLTQDWLTQLTETLNGHEGFTAAIANTELSLQFDVSDAPDGSENRYFINVAGGSAECAAGDTDAPDATISNNYETAVAISKGDLNTQMAFMTGKLKVDGNMAKLMMNQAMLTKFAEAASNLEIEY
jgi:putative sterol carrier protein